MRRVALHALCALALLGCGDPERSAGGSSYETENAVAARFLQADGSPAIGVTVRARPLSWIAGDPADAVVALGTDSLGRMQAVLPDGAWRLEARLAGALAVVDVPADRSRRDFGDRKLAAPASLYGRSVPGTRIGIGGLAIATVVDSTGWFRFDTLPAGIHIVREIGGTRRSYAVTEPGKTADAGVLRVETAGEILLDDFEDGDARIRTAPWTGNGWWWFDADPGVGLSPDSVREFPGRAVVSEGDGGKVLHVSAIFPSGADTTSRARCGTDFGTRPLDLSGLVSVRFRARGIGTLTLVVDIDGATPAEVPQATVVLDSLWTEFDIPVASLRLPAWSGSVPDPASRTALLRRAVGLGWSLGESGDLWLDDVRLEGPSSTLLWGSAPPP